MAIIDDCVGLLVSHKDHHHGPNWADYFKLRKPLAECLGDGQPYWYFNGGPFSLERHFNDPKQQLLYNQTLRKFLKTDRAKDIITRCTSLKSINEAITSEVLTQMSKVDQVMLKPAAKHWDENRALYDDPYDDPAVIKNTNTITYPDNPF